MIREWTVKEAQTDMRVANFMKAFEGATNFVKVDSDYTFKRYMKLMEDGICRIFIAEEGENLQGAIGFIISSDLHDGAKTAIETFWFVHPDYKGIGKELFNTFEIDAKCMGCTKLAMIHLSDSYPESLQRFYIRNGYKLLEKHYVKEI